MNIPPIKRNEPTFGYKSVLKTRFKQGKLPTVKYGIYGELLNDISLEHLNPKSKGGISTLANYALANKSLNKKRGSEPLLNFTTKQNIINYLIQFKNISIKGFKGNKYIKSINKTLNKLGIFI